jgi:hypothetical protein
MFCVHLRIVFEIIVFYERFLVNLRHILTILCNDCRFASFFHRRFQDLFLFFARYLNEKKGDLTSLPRLTPW